MKQKKIKGYQETAWFPWKERNHSGNLRSLKKYVRLARPNKNEAFEYKFIQPQKNSMLQVSVVKNR